MLDSLIAQTLLPLAIAAFPLAGATMLIVRSAQACTSGIAATPTADAATAAASGAPLPGSTPRDALQPSSPSIPTLRRLGTDASHLINAINRVSIKESLHSDYRPYTGEEVDMTYRNASWLATILAMSLGKQAFALSATSAPPARGDPPITEGAGGGTGTGGGADPPGGITDAPPPETPNTDGSWTATVGGTEFAGLTEADVGRVLWRGERVNVTHEDADGLVQTVSVCEGFPKPGGYGR